MRSGFRLKGVKIVRKGGKTYLYRRIGTRLVPLPNLPENHPEFIAAWNAAENAAPPTRAPSGSIAALVESYLASRDYAALGASTRAVWRRVADKIRDERGKGLVKDLRPEHLRKDLRTFTPGARQNRMKVWRSLLRYAVAEGWIDADPSDAVKVSRRTETPHRQWTAEHVARFRDHWPTGSPERVAFEVICWTGARCVDAVRLGWQGVDRTGWLGFTQAKTGNPVSLPIMDLPAWAAPMAEEIAHLRANIEGKELLWITTRSGKPRSVKGLSQSVSAWAKAAGLGPDLTAHGLRKYRASRLAEIGASTHQVGAWIGDVSLGMVSHYTRAADRKVILLGPEQERNLGNRLGNRKDQKG